MSRVTTKKATGTRRGPRRRHLPGLKHLKTVSAKEHRKKLPRKPENPVIDDGDFDFDRPPDVLSIDGVKLWRSVVKLLRTVGELHSSDYFGLRHLCYHHQRICKRERADQDVPTNERNTFNRLLIEYGMTPASKLALDRHGKLRQNGPAAPGFGKTKVFEEQDAAVEGEEKERANKVTNLEDRAAALL
jgi:hypothetical protein